MQFAQLQGWINDSLRLVASSLIWVAAIANQPAHGWELALQPPAYNQSAACQQDRSNTFEQLSYILTERFIQEFEAEQYQKAIATFVRNLELIQMMPDAERRSGQFVGLTGANLDRNSDRWLAQISQFEVAGQGSAIIQALDQAVQVAQTFGGDNAGTQTRSLISIARAYQRLNRPDKASQTLALALDTYRSSQGQLTLLAIAQTYRTLENRSAVRAVLQQAQQTASQLEDAAGQAEALAQVGMAYAEADEWRSAQTVAQQLNNAPQEQGAVLRAIAQSYLRTDQIQQARAIANRIRDSRIKASSLGDLARYDATTQGNDSQATTVSLAALQVVQQPENDDIRLAILAELIQWNPDRALPLVQQIADVHQQIPLLGQLAIRYNGTAQTAKATAAVTQIQTAFQTLDPSWQTLYANQIVEKAMQFGDYASALWLVGELSAAMPEARSAILRQHVIPILAAKGEILLLRQAVDAVPEDEIGLKTGALETLVTAYVRAGQVEQASTLLVAPNDTDRPGFLRWVQVQAAIARELVLSGRQTAGMQQFQQLQERVSAHPDPQIKVEALGKIAIALTQAKQPVNPELIQSLTTMARLIQPLMREIILKEMIRALFELDQDDIALSLALELDPDFSSEREISLSRIAEHALNGTHYELALQVIDQLQSPRLQVLQLLALGDRYLLDQVMDQPAQLLDRAVAIARAVPGDEAIEQPTNSGSLPSFAEGFDRSSLLEAIALQYTILGHTASASETVALIQDAGLRDRITLRLRCYQPVP